MKKIFTLGKYILDESGNPVKETSLLKWAKWFEKSGEERRVARTRVGDNTVSTIFLGMDHNFDGGTPILYETLIFHHIKGESGDGKRYCTREEAIRGHFDYVKKLNDELQNPS